MGWFSILHNGWGMHLHPVAAVSFYFHGVQGGDETTFLSISQVDGRGCGVRVDTAMD